MTSLEADLQLVDVLLADAQLLAAFVASLIPFVAYSDSLAIGSRAFVALHSFDASSAYLDALVIPTQLQPKLE